MEKKLPNIIAIFLIQLSKESIIGNHVTGGIGNNRKLLYSKEEVPGDMERFTQLSKGSTIIVGPDTYEGFYKKPLPGRTNIIVSRKFPEELTLAADGSYRINDLYNAIPAARAKFPDQEIVIAGGKPIYEKLLPLCDIIYATEVYGEKEVDTEITYSKAFLHEVERIKHEHNGLKYDFVTYKRVRPENPELRSDGS